MKIRGFFTEQNKKYLVIPGVLLLIASIYCAIRAQIELRDGYAMFSIFTNFHRLIIPSLFMGLSFGAFLLSNCLIRTESGTSRSPVTEPLSTQKGDKNYRAPVSMRQKIAAVLFLVGAFLLLAFTALGLKKEPYRPQFTATWIGSIVLIILFTALIQNEPVLHIKKQCAHNIWHSLRRNIYLILLIAVLFAIQAPTLSRHPGILDLNEGNIGIASARLLTEGWRFNIFDCWFQRNFSYVTRGLAMLLWGKTIFSLRIVSLIMGLLALIPMKFLLERLFSRRTALWVITLMGISYFYIHYSRTGLNNIDAQFVIILFFLFFLKGLETRRHIYFLLCGMLASLGFYIYQGALVLLAVLPFYFFFEWICRRDFFKTYLVHIIFLLLGIGAIVTPLTAWQMNPQRKKDIRPAGVFLLTSHNMEFMYRQYKTENIAMIIALHELDSFLSPVILEDRSINFGIFKPLFDTYTCALFMLGFLVSLTRPRKYLLFLLWYCTGIVVFHGLATWGSPCYSPRLVTVIPVIYIFVGVILEEIRSLLRSSLTTFGISKFQGVVNYGIWAAIGLLVFINVQTYHTFFLKEHRGAFFRNNVTEIAYAIQPYVNDHYIVLFGDGGHFLGHHNIDFLNNNIVRGTGVQMDNVPWEQIRQHPNLLFLGLMGSRQMLETIQKEFPGGEPLSYKKIGEKRDVLWGYVVTQ